MSHIIDSKPSFHGEAMGENVWQDAMKNKYQSILKNDVWDIVRRPEGKFVVNSKWIYKINHTVDGSVKKYKERFVARGISQVEGVDYDETFYPIPRYTSICTIISLATSMSWKLDHMDVNTTFLNGEIEEEVYIEKLEGFVIQNQAMYGLKQALRSWYDKMDGFVKSLGFHESTSDPNLYYDIFGKECLILVLYVDDLFLISSKSLIIECKQALNSELEMKCMGMIHYFLGLEV
jgi:hypothetical protein